MLVINEYTTANGVVDLLYCITALSLFEANIILTITKPTYVRNTFTCIFGAIFELGATGDILVPYESKEFYFH